MYKTIVLDCQTKVDSFNCEDCIAFKECTISKNRSERFSVAIEVEAITASI